MHLLRVIFDWILRRKQKEIWPVTRPVRGIEYREEELAGCSEDELGASTMGRIDYTGLLYSQPSMLEGFARVLDIGGTFDSYNTASTPAEADRLAMASDWYAVSADLLRAMEEYKANLRAAKADRANAR